MKFIFKFLLQILFFVILVHRFYYLSEALSFLSNTGNIISFFFFSTEVKCPKKTHLIYSQWKKD